MRARGRRGEERVAEESEREEEGQKTEKEEAAGSLGTGQRGK